MCRENCRGGRRCPGATSDSGKRAAAQRSRGARLRRKLAGAGVTVTHGRNTPLTFVAIDGDVDFDPAAIPPVVDRQHPPWKPDGGLWSAPAVDTVHDGIATAWTMFHADNGSRPSWKRLVPVTVSGGGVVVHIDTPDDLARLRSLYPPASPESVEVLNTLAAERAAKIAELNTAITKQNELDRQMWQLRTELAQLRGEPEPPPPTPVDLQPHPPPVACSLESPPFSFEKMATDGVSGVHITSEAINRIDTFYSWDVDSTIWLNADSVVAHTPVDAAQLPPNHYRPANDDPTGEEIGLRLLADDRYYTV